MTARCTIHTRPRASHCNGAVERIRAFALAARPRGQAAIRQPARIALKSMIRPQIDTPQASVRTTGTPAAYKGT